jgi:hypothetical protein
MNTESGRSPIADPNAILERTLIADFIRARGYDPSRLHELPEADRRRLESDASTYAASRLAEMEARAHYVHELHGDR